MKAGAISSNVKQYQYISAIDYTGEKGQIKAML